MDQDLLEVQKSNLVTVLTEVQDEHGLMVIKSNFLGKKSEINELMKKIPSLPIDERKDFGAMINSYREIFTNMISEKQTEIDALSLKKKLTVDNFDPTIPYSNGIDSGSQHVLTRTVDELLSIMSHLGFKTVSGPEIEDDYYNFTALNIPPLHPARQSQDTFYVGEKLLRTQTSSVQVRHMESNKPPYYIVSVGKCYRVDDSDQTHLPMFNQMECLCVDTDISMLDLKETIHNMLKMFFVADELPIRFRSSYFPFTTPSVEVDMMYQGRWLELGGAGMVHKNVLQNVNINPDEYQGFAFGFGIERLAMIKNKISDIRDLVRNDVRFLRHYG